MSVNALVETFSALGGEFISPASDIQKKLQNIKVFLFDWDGVFNNGNKGGDTPSGFSEADSMGTNLLRFGHWLRHQQLPFTAIITGENNTAAIQLAEREHFNSIYYQVRDKATALKHLQTTYNIKLEEVAFCFDDVLDLPIAKQCGLRFMINRSSSPLFAEYVKQQHNCDYISAHSGGQHAVREICELILGLTEKFTTVVEERCAFSPLYQSYLQTRNAGDTQRFTQQQGTLVQT